MHAKLLAVGCGSPAQTSPDHDHGRCRCWSYVLSGCLLDESVVTSAASLLEIDHGQHRH